MIKCTWEQIKQAATTRSIPLQWTQDDNSYTISLVDGSFQMTTIMPITNPASYEQSDFESNFKDSGNKSQSVMTTAFSSKTYAGKNLFKRVVGIKSDVVQGDNTIVYTLTFPWVKFMAIEIINADVGDTASLLILDTVNGDYTGVPNATLNQFGFTANVGPGFYQQKSEFDADVYQGLQIQIVYNSVSAKTIGINFVMNEVK